MGEKRKKIYISLPISDRDMETQRKRAEQLARRIAARGMEPVNPFDIAEELIGKFGVTDGKPTWFDYMAEDLFNLLQCDGILMDFDSKQSYGCSIEMAVAQAMASRNKDGFTIYHTKEQWHTVRSRYII